MEAPFEYKIEIVMNEHNQPASNQPEAPQRKLGANHGEIAARPRKRHANFKQSVDLREDRGIRQWKTNPKGRN